MDRLPPKWVRRIVLAPLVFLLCLLLLVVSPFVLVLAALVDLFAPGSWRTVRMVLFGIVYIAMEALGLLVMLGLWISFGFGTRLKSEESLQAHFGFMTFFLATMYR